jgi:hypothetical protein
VPVQALALPPATRTVGQLVAESVRLYGSQFWPAIALGIGPALVGVTFGAIPDRTQLAVAMTVGAMVMSACYAVATAMVTGIRPDPRSLSVAVTAGVIVAIPVPYLISLFLLPAIAWLAFFGLAVPAAIVERRGILESLGRGIRLARADYIHAVGALAALTIVGLLATFALLFVLREQGDVTIAVAAFLSLLVTSPLLFLGGALLYVDQVARATEAEAA